MEDREFVTFGKDKYHLNREMEQWCEEHIGPGGWVRCNNDLWNVTSIFGDTTFSFKEKEHLTWFMLVWG
jgi:hypothetical protein